MPPSSSASLDSCHSCLSPEPLAPTASPQGGRDQRPRIRGTPSDIASVTSFLISEEGRWISGQLLHADGGFSARF
ncbi:SDR family oxidoreductase [Microbacterium sp. A196]|uniref:SDR family oxidoreductase n=1 Tax=unclassified Microbacterium TaxID=2609290 RepID=UPI003FD29877